MTQPGPGGAARILRSYPARLAFAVVLVVGGALMWNRVLEPALQQQPAAAAAAPGQLGDGTWLVGVDVQPGTYRSPGATTVGGFNFCLWRRLSDTSGENSAIIASGTGNAGEQQLVTIAATDRAFRVSGCEPFTRVG